MIPVVVVLNWPAPAESRHLVSQTGIHLDDLLVEFEGHGWLFDGRRLEPNGETTTPEEMLERLTERLPMDGLSFSIISLETDEVDGYSVWAAVVNGNQPLDAAGAAASCQQFGERLRSKLNQPVHDLGSTNEFDGKTLAPMAAFIGRLAFSIEDHLTQDVLRRLLAPLQADALAEETRDSPPARHRPSRL